VRLVILSSEVLWMNQRRFRRRRIRQKVCRQFHIRQILHGRQLILDRLLRPLNMALHSKEIRFRMKMWYWKGFDLKEGSHASKQRGHSNNTWHFFGPFLTSPRVTFYFFKWLLFRLICFEILNVQLRKYIIQPVKQGCLLPKTIISSISGGKKFVWHIIESPPPEMSRII